MATAPTSYAPSLIFTQSEATAAQATWTFHLVKSADSTDATGLTPVMTISKAGAAFASPNAGTAITELTNGWYKVVHNAADFDTLGCLAVRIAVATADTINVAHQVTALDTNIATIAPTAGSINAAAFSTDGLAAISAGFKSVRKTIVLTANTTNSNGTAVETAISMSQANSVTVDLSGTFGSGSAQIQVSENPDAATPTWTNSGSAITTAGRATVTGPHRAIQVVFTGSTTPNLTIVYTFQRPQFAL